MVKVGLTEGIAVPPTSNSAFRVVHNGQAYSIGPTGLVMLDAKRKTVSGVDRLDWVDPTETECMSPERKGPPGPAGVSARYRLMVKGRSSLSLTRPVLVGRSPVCDLVLDDASVSRIHALVLPASDRIRVVDLASHNGTRAGAMAVRDTEFFDAALLSFGNAECTLSREPADARATLSSPGMRHVERQLRAFAVSDAPVVVLGETGVGKDSIAGRLHALSGRTGSLVAVNAASLTAALARSELFGHTAGAFTGAEGSRIGAFELADRGTLFLDEVCDLPLSVQAELLRTLDSGEVMPVGASEPRWVSTRVIVASNVPLEQAVHDGKLREDLYYRLSVLQLTVPPLRERQEDTLTLASLFLSQLGKRVLSDDAKAWLAEQQWAGNIRELRAVITRAALFSESTMLSAAELGRAAAFSTGSRRCARGHGEIIETWLRYGRSAARTAKELGVHRATVHRHIQRYRQAQAN